MYWRTGLCTLCLVSVLPIALAQDFETGLKAYESGNYGEALKHFSPLADEGSPDAQYHLGLMYASGRGVPQSSGEAVRWYRLAAEQGNTSAQLNLGFMYNQSEGEVNHREAARWYRLAAEQGDADAQYNLGIMYYHGRGVPQDHEETVRWYRKAAEQGDGYAQYGLGFMYANGDGIRRDDKEAVKWYRKAAEQGNASAQFGLGFMYANGRGVPQSYSEAERLGYSQIVRWSSDAPSDSFFAQGVRVKRLLHEDVQISVVLYDQGKYLAAQIMVENFGNEAVDINPERFEVEFSKNGKVHTAVPPNKVTAGSRWASLVAGIGGGMAAVSEDARQRRPTVVRRGGDTIIIYDQDDDDNGGGTTAYNRAEQERAAQSQELRQDLLLRTTLFPDRSVVGWVFFPRNRKDEILVRTLVGGEVYEFPFRFADNNKSAN